MGKHRLVSAVVAGAAIIVLAGCSGVPSGTAPDVPGASTGGPGATSLATNAVPAGVGQQSRSQASGRPSGRPSHQSSDQQGATSATGSRQDAAAFVKANSIPFPIAVGNTWVYRTTVDGQTGQTTNRIVSGVAGTAGYVVTMDSTTDVAGTSTTVPLVFVFYPDGTIGYPVPLVGGLSVLGGGVRWPDAAGLASGQAYHSVVRILISQTGQYENANVTVRGAGTASVSVPAGTYQASVVTMTITAKAASVQLTSWIAQGVGPVQTDALIQAAGMTEYSITNVLISFTKAAPGIGS
jgi:hypothetical protein